VVSDNFRNDVVRRGNGWRIIEVTTDDEAGRQTREFGLIVDIGVAVHLPHAADAQHHATIIEHAGRALVEGCHAVAEDMAEHLEHQMPCVQFRPTNFVRPG
jgi:hypothetical protein